MIYNKAIGEEGRRREAINDEHEVLFIVAGGYRFWTQLISYHATWSCFSPLLATSRV